MPHIIEVLRDTAGESRSFLDALFYSDSVSAIGYRLGGVQIRAVAINWEENEESEIDKRILLMVKDAIEANEDLDEIAAYCRIFPETVLYQPELKDIQ